MQHCEQARERTHWYTRAICHILSERETFVLCVLFICLTPFALACVRPCSLQLIFYPPSFSSSSFFQMLNFFLFYFILILFFESKRAVSWGVNLYVLLIVCYCGVAGWLICSLGGQGRGGVLCLQVCTLCRAAKDARAGCGRSEVDKTRNKDHDANV